MLKKLFGKKDTNLSENSELEQEIKSKVLKMNLTEMKSYINNNIKDFLLTSYGLNEVLKKLVLPNEESKKCYLSIDDADIKKKKAFDLVILTMKNSNMTLETLELVKKFTDVHEKLISKYDKDHKEIYTSRFKDAINMGVLTLEHLLHLRNKTTILS